MKKRLEKRADGVYLVLGEEKSRARLFVCDELEGTYALEWAGRWADGKRAEYRVRSYYGWEKLYAKTYLTSLMMVTQAVYAYNEHESAVALLGQVPDLIEVDPAVDELLEKLRRKMEEIGKRIAERKARMEEIKLMAAHVSYEYGAEIVDGERTRDEVHHDMTFGYLNVPETAHSKTLEEIHRDGGI